MHLTRVFRSQLVQHASELIGIPDAQDGPSRTGTGYTEMDGDYVRIYVDAAYQNNACKYGLVVLCSNSKFLYACSGSMRLSSPLEAECYAIWKALVYLTMHPYSASVIYSDSLLATQYLSSDEKTWPWYVAGILAKCKKLMHIDSCLVICYLTRGMNIMAHILAKETPDGAVDLSWESTPDFLIPHLPQDQ